jgi:DNA processing protein
MMEYWIWLSQLPLVGPITANKLLNDYNNPLRIYESDLQELSSKTYLNSNQLKQLQLNHSLKKAYEIIGLCQKKNVQILTLQNPLYPEKAKLPDAPAVLYYRGCLKMLSETIGIVGARRCTQESKKIAISKAKYYAENNVTVISGMAKGIDSYAHTSCLKSGGYTLAFLGNGPDICYPKEHDILMKKIIENGAVISEYPPETQPSQYAFPRRNRLISAWSDELIVIGAGRGSGTNSTAAFAGKYGRRCSYFKTNTTSQ